MQLKILHLSHTGLPDPRIERLAVMSNAYSQSFFLGDTTQKKMLHEDAFDQVFYIDEFNAFANTGTPYFYQKLRSRIRKVVKSLDIDLLYAHNVIVGKIAHDLSIPYVYDDHEYWSRQTMLRRLGIKNPVVRVKNAIRYFWIPEIYRKWEREILKSAKAVVTVSEAIAIEHRRHCDNCVIIPNFPLEKEFGDLVKPTLNSGTPRGICLAGNFGGFLQHRYPGKNRELWEREGGIIMDWVGKPPPSNWKWIKHRDWIHPSTLLDVLTTDYQFGLIPWTAFWYHRYSFPNKAATYSHAGLIFVMHRDFYSLVRFLPPWSYYTYRNSEEFIDTIHKIKSLTPEEILSTRNRLQEWAKENMIMDKYYDELESVLKSAI